MCIRDSDRRMGCFGSKPRVARLAMAPAYPGQGDFPHAHYKQAAQPQHAPAFSHQPATTSAPVYLFGTRRMEVPWTLGE